MLERTACQKGHFHWWATLALTSGPNLRASGPFGPLLRMLKRPASGHPFKFCFAVMSETPIKIFPQNLSAT